jgi:ABC-type transport system involved in cytochrome c biogenesis permease subunit
MYVQKARNAQLNPATVAWNNILNAYTARDVSRFNREVASYQATLRSAAPTGANLDKTEFEAFYNHFAPSFYCSWLYVLAFLLGVFAWLGWTRPLNRAATGLILLAFVVHTFTIIARVYISGRPPVTNLYTTAVFIGWGGVLFGLLIEWVYRIGIGNLIAAVSGAAGLGISFLLAGDGDTFTVLQAVLDTQFWLTTHVLTINLGYSATFVAGTVGLFYIVLGLVTPAITPRVSKEFTRMIYGILCFAIFFSFIGTVLGGLWADDSWGRFWGWDPKENGALIIVLWNALCLHAYWGGMVKQRGLAVLAVGGNIVTSWSWFGVNELNVGLHSYGFTEGVLFMLGMYVLSQLAIMALGVLPSGWWWSHRRHESLS